METAEVLYREKVTGFKKTTHGDNNCETVVAIECLANRLAMKKAFVDAERFMREGLASTARVNSAERKETVASMANLAALLADSGGLRKNRDKSVAGKNCAVRRWLQG